MRSCIESSLLPFPEIAVITVGAAAYTQPDGQPKKRVWCMQELRHQVEIIKLKNKLSVLFDDPHILRTYIEVMNSMFLGLLHNPVTRIENFLRQMAPLDN